MRRLVLASLLAFALPLGSMADKPSVGRPMIKAMEASIELELLRTWPTEPIEVLGVTHGAYVEGYGAVFMTELNLALGAGISPFHPQITVDEAKRLHEKKMARLPQLKNTMRVILMNCAGSLDSVPDDQQIALAVTLFYFHGESTEKLPSQIVMHGQKRALLDVKTGRAEKSTLAAVIAEREF
jgi:hypothetical protein